MKKQRSNTGNGGGNPWFRALVSALAAAAISVALVALYAFILQKQWLGVETVGYANTAVKLICSAAAALIAARAGSRPWLWGAVSAGVYMALTHVVFSMIAGSFSLDSGFFTDLGMCMLCGAVVGLLKNLAKR